MSSKLIEALIKADILISIATFEEGVRMDEVDKIRSEIKASIAALPRNCDVGTPKEQSARFDAHCRKHMGCLTCPLREKDGGVPKHCEFAWAQMPYEEGGAE